MKNCGGVPLNLFFINKENNTIRTKKCCLMGPVPGLGLE